MEKYQVFISSVSNELLETRSMIISRLLKKNRYFPIAMEYFVASDNTMDMLWDYMKQTNIVVLLLKEESGSKIGPEGAARLQELSAREKKISAVLQKHGRGQKEPYEELTFTQVECLFATALRIPILSFIYRDDAKQSIDGDKLNGYMGSHLNCAAGWSSNEELAEVLITSLDTYIEGHSINGWIRQQDSPLYKKSSRAGILDIDLEGINCIPRLKKQIKHCREILMFYTTGKNFILGNVKDLAEFVADGGNIRLITGMSGSLFLDEVARIERFKFGDRQDIHDEFDDVFKKLLNILAMAKDQHAKNRYTGELGHIYFAVSNTLFRSSILCAEMEDGRDWGWLTITLPPEKSKDMISLELDHTPDSGNDNGDNLLRAVKDHCLCVWRIAEMDGMVMEIEDHLTLQDAREHFTVRQGSSLSGRNYWQKKQYAARKNSRRLGKNKKVLIEIAAQHPLVDGEFPNREFAARLDRGAELYHRYLEEGKSVEIYVPGSIHPDVDGFWDEISLSEAGIRYLLAKGIPEDILHGDDLVERYASERALPGCYNTGDECDLASRYFAEPDKYFGSLVCVCSPNQVMRKSLFYIEHGIMPQIVTVPMEQMYHDFIYEIYQSVPNILMYDHDYQAKDSKEGNRTRRERMEGFGTEF